jgi:hypothetical protein
MSTYDSNGKTIVQGMDGMPYMTYYDKTHALSFSWDTTVGNWVDVSYGGSGEPVIARIPIVGFDTVAHPVEWTLTRFKSTCDGFVTLIHEIEQTTIGHVHDNVGTLE